MAKLTFRSALRPAEPPYGPEEIEAAIRRIEAMADDFDEKARTLRQCVVWLRDDLAERPPPFNDETKP